MKNVENENSKLHAFCLDFQKLVLPHENIEISSNESAIAIKAKKERFFYSRNSNCLEF